MAEKAASGAHLSYSFQHLAMRRNRTHLDASLERVEAGRMYQFVERRLGTNRSH
jgi:hypothetical protein